MILIPITITVFASFLLIRWMTDSPHDSNPQGNGNKSARRHLNRSFTSPAPTVEQSSHRNNQKLIWILSTMTLIAGIAFHFSGAILTGFLLPIIPFASRWQKERQHRRLFDDQMDSMLANLANAVSVTGNLSNAIEDVAEGEPEPMHSELMRVLHEIRLGNSEDDALQKMAERSGLPLFRTAITAMIVGKRSGGQLAQILGDTAASIRELKRLDGVLKTKTAEGRTQAWVMGLVPFFLCGALQLINPDWLVPLWTTPFGWVLLACALLLEIIAIVLIRKILAVAL